MSLLVRGRAWSPDRDLTIVRGETRMGVLARRSLSITVVLAAFCLVLIAAPIWIPVALVADALSGFRSAFLRSVIFLVVYLYCEVAGVVACLWISLSTPRLAKDGSPSEVYFRRHFALQRWWAGTLMRWLVRLFRIRFEVEGRECLDRPMILMLSHSSIADTLLASEFVSKPHGIHLRYVLKRELLVDPCLDIVGHRLPNYFVDRESDDPRESLSDLRRLLSGLRPNEGALIYPEGTRFSAVKREALISRWQSRGDLDRAARASALRNTLPPRLGGAIALLEANPGLDVVFGAHSGFESVARPADVLRGSLIDARIAVRFWRVPVGAIPLDRAARAEWLFDQWQDVDRWIGEKRGEDASIGESLP